MNNRRLNFLIKVSQEILEQKSDTSPLEKGKVSKINEILETITGNLPFIDDEAYAFKPPDKTLLKIEEFSSVATDEEIKKVFELAAALGASSPEEGRKLTSEIGGMAKEQLSSEAFDTRTAEKIQKKACEEIFERIFKAKLASKIEKSSLEIFCKDLKEHGAFKLYEKRGISKIASKIEPQIISFERNLEIFNSRINTYNDKKSVASLGAILPVAGRYIARALPTLVGFGARALSGAWKIVSKFGKGIFRLLPYVGVIWDVWDLSVYARKVWLLWNDELAKFSSYGNTKDLINLEYIKSLYEKHKQDTSESGLNKIMDIVKITKLSQSFDLCFVKGLTSFVLVIEDIIVLLSGPIGILGFIIDVAASLGIIYAGSKIAANRQAPFNEFKMIMYQDLESLKEHGKIIEGLPTPTPSKEDVEEVEEPQYLLSTVKGLANTGIASLTGKQTPAIS